MIDLTNIYRARLSFKQDLLNLMLTMMEEEFKQKEKLMMMGEWSRMDEWSRMVDLGLDYVR